MDIKEATQRSRRLLEDDFREQLESVYDLLIDARGKIPEEAGKHLKGRDRHLRGRMLAAIRHKERSAGMSGPAALADFVRDAAFTTLNRFAALRMLEDRDLVRPCIRDGEQSIGYHEYCGLAPELALLPNGQGYRLYIESLFDELGQEIKVLFDRRDVASALWPRRATLEGLLALFNHRDLASVWREDETIGWVYQYFNSDADREAARYDAEGRPKPPGSSREMAVRNQFFTPRYVVELLTDNTLGRTWFEMRAGRTALRDRPYFVWVKDDPIPPRAMKDPRDLRVLDPACGSGHFLLYAFDLLLVIYAEAWDDDRAPASEATGRRLRDDYPDRAELDRAVPGLILRHNLHGVDIDPRCAQIGALALWMRAQRAFADAAVARVARPRITRTNIVVAEPMPGEADLVDEFAATLRPAILGDLFKTLVGKMKLAGELGSLLRIEADLSAEIKRARDAFESSKHRSLTFDFAPTAEPEQQSLDFADITGTAFFDAAEGLIVDALGRYVQSVGGLAETRRRLFADDAEQGLALLHLMQRRYDVVLMNPPFGAPTSGGKSAGIGELAKSANDVGAAFVLAAKRRWAPEGKTGVVSSTALWFKPTVRDWREEALLDETHGLVLAAHLGGDVLDDATVSASAVVLADDAASAVFFRCLHDADKASALIQANTSVRAGHSSRIVFRVPRSEFRSFRGAALAYWISTELRRSLAEFPPLEPTASEVRVGVQTSDDPRFVRGWWEVDPDRVGLSKVWAPFAKSSEYSPFWDDVPWVVRWEFSGREVDAFDRAFPRSTQFFGRAGVTYPARSVLGFNPRAFPAECGFGHMGSVAFPVSSPVDVLLGYLASRPVEYVLSFSNGSLQGRKGAFPNHYEVGQIKDLPWPDIPGPTQAQIGRLGTELCTGAMHLQDDDETTHQYQGRPGLGTYPTVRGAIEAAFERRRELVANVRQLREELDRLVADALGFSDADVAEMMAEFALCEAPTSGPWSPSYPQKTADAVRDEAAALFSELFGMAIGRFDLRLAAGSVATPNRRSAIDPLPPGPPALLSGSPPAYPIRVASDGVLSDDPGRPSDMESAVQNVIEAIWPGHAGPVQAELCELLGVGTIREYLQRRSGGFWDDHTNRYQKSRRCAPIYWRLGTPSGAYSVWLYVHRLRKDTLFSVLQEHVEPRLAFEEKQLEQMRAEGTNASARMIEQKATLVEELRSFRSELARVAPLWDPDLDDGVTINFAPLWRLVPYSRPWQEKCRATWDDLVAGKNAWAHLAMRLWPGAALKKCREDRSIAIAHGLEETFWEKGAGDKWRPRGISDEALDAMARERTSPAVEAALTSLYAAPEPPARSGRGRRRKTDVEAET